MIQLWPEHFDAGCDVTVGTAKATLGASTGDQHFPIPYLYVMPWEKDRPGDPDYWNASFGAVLTYDDLTGNDDPERASTFIRRGLDALSA